MIILASGSPRRHELLKKLCSNFKIQVSDAIEVQNNLEPKILAVENAKLKAQDVFNKNPGAIVIGADTIVVLNGKIFGKPKNPADAEKMLSQLANKRHEVITGLAICAGGKIFTDYDVTEVYFGEMTTEEIKKYVATGEPLDKSGSYALQGGATKFIEKIHGDWSNVVGLPVYRLKKLAQEAGINFEETRNDSRN